MGEGEEWRDVEAVKHLLGPDDPEVPLGTQVPGAGERPGPTQLLGTLTFW